MLKSMTGEAANVSEIAKGRMCVDYGILVESVVVIPARPGVFHLRSFLTLYFKTNTSPSASQKLAFAPPALARLSL